MATSQNGWPAASERKSINIQTFSVPVSTGTVKVPLRAEAAQPLITMIQWWDRNIEPVYTSGKNAGTWGYAFRTIKGYETTLSNHASGTAIDINAPLHPLGARNTVPADKVAAIRAKARELGLRWGGDYAKRADEMHFEINYPPSEAVQRAAAAQAAQQTLAQRATETAAYTEAVAEAAGERGKRAALAAARSLRRNWIIVGSVLAAVTLLGAFAIRGRKAQPQIATNPRRRRRARHR